MRRESLTSSRVVDIASIKERVMDRDRRSSGLYRHTDRYLPEIVHRQKIRRLRDKELMRNFTAEAVINFVVRIQKVRPDNRKLLVVRGIPPRKHYGLARLIRQVDRFARRNDDRGRPSFAFEIRIAHSSFTPSHRSK